MVQATTPTFVLTLPTTVNLSEAATVYFTLSQGSTIITKSGENLEISQDGNEVSVFLSQYDTVNLAVGRASIQLNWTYNDGSRACSKIVSINIDGNLLKEVVE